MSHPAQRDWCQKLKERFPHFFKSVRVVDFGSLDINGNNRALFEDSDYTGVDIGPGPNVDIISLCHEFPGNDKRFDHSLTFDVVCSTEMLEHDIHWHRSLKRMLELVRSGGLLFFTCKSTGSKEHGTIKFEPESSPWTSVRPGWASYYRNLDKEDMISALFPSSYQDNHELIPFLSHEFSFYDHYEPTFKYRDLRFWGIKK